MAQTPFPTEDQPVAESPAEQPHSGHRRRPPLAEIDSWELWQAWRRGERGVVAPWIGLLVGFCVVLAAMYAFFFFSTGLSDDSIAQLVLSLLLIAFLFALWRRISARRGFAFIVVAMIMAVSGGAFGLWLLVYSLSGWNPCAAFLGIMILGLGGLLIGLSSLNAIGRRQALEQEMER